MLPLFGFSGLVMSIYPCLAAGYFILFLMYSAMLFLYYFNDSVNDLNVRLFENDIQGWVHGPVSVTLYKAFPFKGMECLEPLNGVDDIPVTDKQTIGVLEEVYDVYKDFSGNELEAMTHKQDPWIESRESLEPYEPGKKYLKDETIFRYFCHLADA